MGWFRRCLLPAPYCCSQPGGKLPLFEFQGQSWSKLALSQHHKECAHPAFLLQGKLGLFGVWIISDASLRCWEIPSS